MVILKMMFMKNKIFYLKLILLIFIVFNGTTFNELSKKEEILVFEDISYVLVEKSIVDNNFISYIYKDDNDNYMDKIYDYNTFDEIEIDDILNKDKSEKYNKKIEQLLYLKYPKFVANELIKDNVQKSYLFRSNELVIYFNNYEIEPSVNEVLYLTVNYNEIKDYLNFTFILDSSYENESGYNYTNAKKSVAITFDDSPNVGKTTKILSYLKDNHFHATFFIVGNKAMNNEDLLINIKNSGNEIGSHTFEHQNISKLTNEELIEDYNKMNDIYERIFNDKIKYFRPPYGIIKTNQLNVLNTSYIMWNLDTNDWRYKNSDYLVNYVLNNIKDGDIILFHDSYNSTVKAIEKLLPILYSKGFQVMSVSELANIKNINIQENKIYYNFN